MMTIPDQTDLFVVNESGQIDVFSVDGGHPWSGPLAIGATSFTPPGAPLVAFQHIDQNRTDVCVVNGAGQLSVFSVDDAGSWSGATQIGPTGFAPPGAALAASRQFGLSQTDLFVIDKSGQLGVFFVHETGGWGGPVHVGPANFAPPGAALTAFQQVGLPQTDVFVVDNTGQLNVFYVYEGGPWGGPVKIGPPGFAPAGAPVAAYHHPELNQTDVFVIDGMGQLSVFSVVANGPWSGPVKIGSAGFAPPGAHVAVGRQAGISQIDVFVVDNDGQLSVFWAFEKLPWRGPTKIGAAGFALPGSSLSTSVQLGIPQTDVFVYDKTGQLNVLYVVEGGPWGGPVKIGRAGAAPAGAKTAVSEQFGVFEPPAAAPGGGLGSYSNYFLAANCDKLTGVKATIIITQDLVAAPPTAGNQPGFAFQFNASSPIDSADPKNPNWIVWQQYIIGVSTDVRGAVNNWTAASLSGNQTINSPAPVLATLAKPSVIPAGTSLTIELHYDNAGNVSGVTYSMEPGNHAVTITLTDLTLTTGGKVTTANLAPIVAFELNLVGPGDGKHAHFTSGAGTIIYSADNDMTPLATLPPCVANDATTGETSNSVYGKLPVGPSNSFTQSLSVNPSTI